MASVDSLVSADWLKGNLDRSDVKILDGTWIMPGSDPALPNGFIPGAQIFDVDEIAAPSTMAHMLPSSELFCEHVSAMGIKNSDHVIIYDRHGFRTAPRVWWTFKMFGHEKLSILNGGLPAWINAGFGVSARPDKPKKRSRYKAQRPSSKVASMSDILSVSGAVSTILDARSLGRFVGTEAEPRAGLRSGRIPGSQSCPFSSIVTADGFLKSDSELGKLFGALDTDLTSSIITTCGSGITAAGLAFALERIGAKDVAVYDGSWTEWGASDAPVETGHSHG